MPTETGTPAHLIKGREAEDLALKHLTSRGLELVERNFRSRSGEIDLIMRDKQHTTEQLVFVEVRYRQTQGHGSPVETVTRSKQAKIIRTALHYLQQNPRWQTRPCRFDVIGITEPGRRWLSKSGIDWIQDAFQA